MAEKIRCLDLGIGKGGGYIVQKPDIWRVGVDLDEPRLTNCVAAYDVVGVRADVDANLVGLPFADRSFKQVDLVFPHYSLLPGLTKDNLWKELYRVLDKTGTVSVIFDTYNGQRKIKMPSGKYLTLRNLPETLCCAARDAGFLVNLVDLLPDQVSNLGTDFARAYLRSTISSPHRIHKAHQLFASKIE